MQSRYGYGECAYTVEPRYNDVLGTMKMYLLYQVSHYIRVKKQGNIKSWDQQNYFDIGGFVISDLFITRFHCTCTCAKACEPALMKFVCASMRDVMISQHINASSLIAHIR